MLFYIKSIKPTRGPIQWDNLNNSTQRTQNYKGHVCKKSTPEHFKYPFLFLVHEHIVFSLEALTDEKSKFCPTDY